MRSRRASGHHCCDAPQLSLFRQRGGNPLAGSTCVNLFGINRRTFPLPDCLTVSFAVASRKLKLFIASIRFCYLSAIPVAASRAAELARNHDIKAGIPKASRMKLQCVFSWSDAFQPKSANGVRRCPSENLAAGRSPQQEDVGRGHSRAGRIQKHASDRARRSVLIDGARRTWKILASGGSCPCDCKQQQ